MPKRVDHYTLPAFTAALCLVCALAATVGSFRLVNRGLEGWAWRALDEGVAVGPPWRPVELADLRAEHGSRHRGAVPEDGLALPASVRRAKLELLRKIDPELFDSLQVFDPAIVEKDLARHFARSLLVLTVDLDLERGRAEAHLDRGVLKDTLERLRLQAGAAREPGRLETPLSFLAPVVIAPPEAIEWQLDRQLIGCAPPSAVWRSWMGLCEPVPPAAAEGLLYTVDRSVPLPEAGAARLELLEDYLLGLVEQLRAESGPARRALLLINGEVQWTTFLAAFWCLFLLLARAVRSRGALRGFRSVADAGERERLAAHHERVLNGGSYALIDWLILVVPMLGFIGTLLGMMLAMGNAGEVVAARGNELQRAMENMTRYLGTAFDTTLVALVLSMLLERLRGALARREMWRLEESRHE